MHVGENAKTRKGSKVEYDAPVSLAPLSTGDALRGLFAIPDPDATKPKHAKKKATK